MTKIPHRITSLERWGMRASIDFQPESVAYVRDAGYTGVLVNGGSGIGPDMLTPETLVASTVIPDLMPLTAQGSQREMRRRYQLLGEAGVKPWLCVWEVPGPDESADFLAAESNRFFDRRSKLEMTAKLRRTPEIFGHRSPQATSWRGNRPLCVSHPLVRESSTGNSTRASLWNTRRWRASSISPAIIMVLNPLAISPFFDWLKFNRAGYLWSAFFYLLSGLVTVKVYHNWKQKQERESDLP